MIAYLSYLYNILYIAKMIMFIKVYTTELFCPGEDCGTQEAPEKGSREEPERFHRGLTLEGFYKSWRASSSVVMLAQHESPQN